MVKSPSKKKLFPTPHLNSLSGIPIHMPLFPPQLWLTASIIIIIIIIIIILKQTEQWYLLLCWKCYDEKVWCRSRFQSQIHPLRECKRLDKKKVLIKLNTSFLLIFNLLLLSLWLSYWMWFRSWWKNNLFWLSTAHVTRTIEAHSAPCTDVAYHPTLPSWVATCGWDGQVKVWT